MRIARDLGLTDFVGTFVVLVAAAALAAPAFAARPPKPRTTPLKEITEAEIRLGEADWLVSDGTAVWVSRGGGYLDRIDPVTNGVTASIDVSDEVCQGIGFGDGAVWTCSGPDLVRVDPTTATVVATIPVDKGKDQGHLPVAGGRVWVITGADAGTLVGVSTASNTPEVTVPLDARCSDATANADAVWLACVSGEVLRVDPASATVSARVRALPLATSIATNDDAVFVGYEGGVARIDPDAGKVTARAKIATSLFEGLAADDTSVWLHSERPFLRRIDATSMRLVERVTASTDSGGSVLLAFGSLWASTYDDAFVYRLDPGAP